MPISHPRGEGYDIAEQFERHRHLLSRTLDTRTGDGQPAAAQARLNSTDYTSAINGRLAERVGFEPTCRLPDKTLSRRPRYDHFGTSPRRGQQAPPACAPPESTGLNACTTHDLVESGPFIISLGQL